MHRLNDHRDSLRFFELSIDLLCIASIEGFFLKVNPTFSTTLGWSQADLLSRRFLDFVHPEDVAGTLLQIEHLAAGRPTIDFENRYRCLDGSYRWLSWRASSDPNVGLIYAVAHDVTALKRANEEILKSLFLAEQASESKSQFLTTMSHELRTPLHAILGYAELITEELAESEGVQPEAKAKLSSDLGRVQEAGQHLLALINQILDLGRVEAGRVDLVYEEFDLRALLQSIMEVVGAVARREGTRLELRAAPELGSMTCDRTLLRQVLLNLLSNAIRFTGPGDVSLVVEPHGADRVAFLVEDNGIGFDSKELPRLFEPFEQADPSPTRLHGGTGLGLTISQRFVSMLGGRIDGSGVPGGGARFWFDLPLHRPRGGR